MTLHVCGDAEAPHQEGDHQRHATSPAPPRPLSTRPRSGTACYPRFHATDEEMRPLLASQLLRDPDNKIRHSHEVADSPSWGDKLVSTHPVRQILPLQAGLESENAGTFSLKEIITLSLIEKDY